MTFTFTFAFLNNCPDITRSVTLIQILHDYVSQKLEKKWLPQYLASEEFAKARADDEAANQFDAADEAERRRKQRMQKMMQVIENYILNSCFILNALSTMWSPHHYKTSLLVLFCKGVFTVRGYIIYHVFDLR